MLKHSDKAHTLDGAKVGLVVDLFDCLLHRGGVLKLKLLVANLAIGKVNFKRYLWHRAAVLALRSTKA